MRRFPVQIAIAVCLALVLTGCGQQSKHYAASSKANTYFTVPNTWREISDEKLSAYEKKNASASGSSVANSVIWQVAFTPMKSLKLSQVYSIQSFDKPIIVARVRSLNYTESQEISYNKLRSIVLPVQTWIEDPTKAPKGFNIIDDYEVYDQGVRGVRSIYSLEDSGVSQTFDQVAMVSDDRRTLYILLSRCITECYTKNQKVIDKIVTSFTVKGKK